MMRLVFLLSAEERNLITCPAMRCTAKTTAGVRRSALNSGKWPIIGARNSWIAVTMPGRGSWQRSGRSTAASTTTAWRCLPTAAASSTPTAIRFSKVGALPAAPPNLAQLPPRAGARSPRNPLPINNRTVLHLLEAVQMLQMKVPGGGPAKGAAYQLRRARHRADRTRLRESARSHRQARRRSRCWAWPAPTDARREGAAIGAGRAGEEGSGRAGGVRARVDRADGERHPQGAATSSRTWCAASSLRVACGNNAELVATRDAFRRPGSRRRLRPSPGDLARQHLCGRRPGPPLLRHALHVAQPDRADCASTPWSR